MRAYMSNREARKTAYHMLDNDAIACCEARRILATSEPATLAQGIKSRHYSLDGLGWAGKTLAQALTVFVEGSL